MTEKELKKELKATAIFLLPIILIVVFLSPLTNRKIENYFWSCLLGYIIICSFFLFLNHFFKSIILKKITNILTFPIGVIKIVGTFIIPFWAILMNTLMYFMFAILIPQLIYLGGMKLHLFEFFKIPTLLYLRITLTVFVCVLLNPILRYIVYNIFPAMAKDVSKLKPFELNKLTDDFLSVDNIRFLIYLIYVFMLIGINFYNLQELSLGKNLNVDKAILQSFVTFIAFDRAFNLLKQLKFRPSIFLDKIVTSIRNKLNDFEDNTH